MSELLDSLLKLMSEEKYQESIAEAQRILGGPAKPLDIATCLYTIGCAKNALGDGERSLPFYLEALSIFPASEIILIGHVQDEIARVQFDLKHFNSALFYIDMAIINFSKAEDVLMKSSCEVLREEILRNS